MRKSILTITLAISSLCGSFANTPKIEPDFYKRVDKDKMNHWVDSVYQTMTQDELIGQLFFMVYDGRNTVANQNNIKNQVKNIHLGGVLFSKSTPANHATLTNIAQSVAKIPLMVTLDGEWGLAMRLSGTTTFPKNMTLGAIQNDSLLFKYGAEVARQCKVMGIHVDFAPSIDVNSNPKNPVIGYRSFGENPERVAQLGVMYAKGMESGNVLAVSKHFPGHGDTSTDSHHTLPLIPHDMERLEAIELLPFKKYINAGLGSVMIGHLNIPVLDDSGQPSSLSKNIVTDLLKEKLGFTGIVFTDGLQMQGVTNESNYCVRALQAGNDVLLAPTHLAREYESVKKAVEDGTISKELIADKCKRVLQYKFMLNVHNASKVDLTNLSQRLNTSYTNWLNKRLYASAVTLLKDKNDIIPLKDLDKKKIAVINIGGVINSHFVQKLRKYASITSFSAQDNASLLALKTKLSSYNTIIFAIHKNINGLNPAIQQLSAGKESILSFFTNPYQIKNFASSINYIDGVILGYENVNLAQDAVAQAIFGGINIDGKLSVSVDNIFKEGDGIDKKKNRLAYGMPEDIGLPSSALDSVRAIAQFGITNGAYPGCQILIAKDGVVILEEAFGKFEYTGTRVVNTDDIYDIASMTKATATLPALMKLYDDDKVSLNDPISQYVSALEDTNKDKISIKDALFHESQLPSFIPYYMMAIDKTSYSGNLFASRRSAIFNAKLDAYTWARTNYKFKPETVSMTTKENYIPLADGVYVNRAYKDSILTGIANSKLRKRKSYLYSCLNFMLVKEVVEKIADEDLDAFTQNSFFRKLGAYTTGYRPLIRFNKDRIVPTEIDNFIRKQKIQGYVHDEGAAFMGGISGNAGLFSNANDLAKLYQMLLNRGEYGGETYLSKKTCQLFTSATSSISRRGLGFDKPEPGTSKGSPTSISTPLSTYGHTGFTGTCFWIDPENNLIYIFLSNRVYPNRSNNKLSSLNIRTRIQESIYRALKKNKDASSL